MFLSESGRVHTGALCLVAWGGKDAVLICLRVAGFMLVHCVWWLGALGGKRMLFLFV